MALLAMHSRCGKDELRLRRFGVVIRPVGYVAKSFSIVLVHLLGLRATLVIRVVRQDIGWMITTDRLHDLTV